MSTKTDGKSIEINCTVPFYDCDPMQVVWHGNYLKYFDRARKELFESRNLDLYDVYSKTQYLFPITKTSAKYILPLRYNDEFICKAMLKDAVYKISIDFEIRLASDLKLCTRGHSEQVTVKTPEMKILYRIPDEVRLALGC